jgi:hypothetical protein
LSPILVRPVREQLEHDRIIRQLHARYRRKYEAGMNPGGEQNAAVGSGPSAFYPDLVLLAQERGHRLQAVVEVETGESVNHLEALAQWAHFARLRAMFHLYVPTGMVDVARRLCEDNQIHVGEIWSYHAIGDEVRFALVHRSREALPAARSRVATPRPGATREKKPPAARKPARPAVAGRKAMPRAAKPPRPGGTVKAPSRKTKRR